MSELTEKGYVIFKDVLSQELVESLRLASEKLVENQTEFLQTLAVPHEGAFLELIFWPKTHEIMRELGFDQKFYAGVFINKKPLEPKRPWHQDWWYWPEPDSGGEFAPQVGVMYYFTDARKENGCLRVIPGSHRKWYESIHGNYFNANFSLADYEEEVAVEVNAGDLLIMDARLLHSTYANQTNENRLAVNLWHCPYPSKLSAEVRLHIYNATQHDWLPDWFRMEKVEAGTITVAGETYFPQRGQLAY